MNYTRFEIDPGAFADLMPEGAKLYMRPALPEIELQQGIVKIKVSDVRLLHPSGVAALEETIRQMANYQDLKEARFIIPVDMDDDTLNIITDIVSGFSFSAEYKTGDYNGGCIAFGSCVTETDAGGRELAFQLNGEFAKFVYQYAQENQEVNLISIIFQYVTRRREEIEAWLQGGNKDHED